MKGDFFPLQTSLISPNFPARQPPGWCVKTSLVFWTAVAVQGSFWDLAGGARALQSAASRLFGGWGAYGECMPFVSADLSPPHQSLTRQLPPKGKPLHPLHFSQQDGRVEIRKLGCFCNSACFLIFCLLPEIVFTMFAQRKEGFPLGGSCRVSD